MWPTRQLHRAALAAHLIEIGKCDVVELMESMAEGWAVRTRNGFVHVTNGPTFSVMLGEFGMDGFIPWEELVLFGLHVLWRSFYPRVATAACFVQSKTLVSPHKPYWTALFAQVAWLILPPEPIRDAMDIGRPDLAHIVQKAYLEWIARVRDPTLVEVALHILLASPWEMCSSSGLWQYVESIAKSACIQIGADRKLSRRLSHSPAMLQECTDIVLTKNDDCAIVLDGMLTLAVHKRDMVFLVLVLLFGARTNWAIDGIPDVVPSQFAEVAAKMPYLFSADATQPYHYFDDLPMLPMVV